MDKKSSVVEEDDKLYLSGELIYRKHQETWVPSLELLRKHNGLLPKVVVDKGTPPFILKGADLMRPGIVSCEDFEAGAIVVMVDEDHGFPIGTGVALFSSEDILAAKGGKVVKTLHNLTSV